MAFVIKKKAVFNYQSPVAMYHDNKSVKRKTLIISKKPGNTGISRDMRTEFTTHLLHSD